MDVENIFSELAAHMIKGFMTHELLANYYAFLNLEGYAKCHEYHYISESVSYRKLCQYYMSHHDRLIRNSKVETPQIIPNGWFDYTKQDVDPKTKRSAIEHGMKLWVDWESETKELYENMHAEFVAAGNVADALMLEDYILDVDDELAFATNEHINAKSIDYDLSVIIPCQKEMRDLYCEKIDRISDYICQK